MKKKYILTARQNTASIILTGKTGNRVRFNFTNGSVIQNQPASFVTENAYYQKLLEESEYYKKGVVRVGAVFRDAVTKAAESSATETVHGIKSAKDAIEWVANKFGEKVTSGARAIEYARKHGYVLVE